MENSDGLPTVEFKNHHNVTSSGAGGKRVLSKLERLLRQHYIRPEHCEAGQRFVGDYLRGVSDRTRSSLNVCGTSSGTDYTIATICRLEAAQRYREAVQTLNESGLSDRGRSPHELLIGVIARDVSFSVLSLEAGVTEEAIKSWICQGLAVLAAYYARVDAIAGKSSTRFTEEAALRRFDATEPPPQPRE